MNMKLNLVFAFLWLLCFQSIFSQRNIGAPELSGGQACARSGSNAFTVIAELNPGNAYPADNEFILELSDINGSFDNEIIELARVSGPNNGTGSISEILFEDFSIPETVGGDTYKIRVRSSSFPDNISELSDDIPFHFLEDGLSIRIKGDSDIIFCDGPDFTKELEIQVTDSSGNQRDAGDFEWQWTKDGTEILGENGTSLTINSIGNYQARIPLGNCQDFYLGGTGGTGRSNRVNVSVIEATEAFVETPSDDFIFCPDEVKILSASLSDFRYTYQWYKDGEPLEGENQVDILLPDNNFGGSYYVDIFVSDDCNLTTEEVVIVNEGSNITELPQQLILIPRQTITLEVTTDAPPGSEVRFYAQTSLQQQFNLSEPTFSFDVTFPGDFRIEVDAQDACDTRLVTETEIYPASDFDITIGTMDDVSCDEGFLDIEILEMVGITAEGLRVPLTEDQLSFFDFQWFNDGVPTGDTGTSLEIDTSVSEGVFELRADLRTGEPEGQNIVSNSLPITLLPQNIELQADPEILNPNSTVTLTAPFNENYTYQWFRFSDGEEIVIEGETTNTLIVDLEGDYFVRISSDLCSTDSLLKEIRGEVVSAAVIPNIISPNGDGINDNWTLPGEYVNQEDVEIVIYNQNGAIDASISSYQNNWPQESSASNGEDALYYFMITKGNEVIRKGSITVMR